MDCFSLGVNLTYKWIVFLSMPISPIRRIIFVLVPTSPIRRIIFVMVPTHPNSNYFHSRWQPHLSNYNNNEEWAITQKISSQFRFTRLILKGINAHTIDDQILAQAWHNFGYKMILAQRSDRSTWKEFDNNFGSFSFLVLQCKGLYL